jgi:hypothetical protein
MTKADLTHWSFVIRRSSTTLTGGFHEGQALIHRLEGFMSSIEAKIEKLKNMKEQV